MKEVKYRGKTIIILYQEDLHARFTCKDFNNGFPIWEKDGKLYIQGHHDLSKLYYELDCEGKDTLYYMQRGYFSGAIIYKWIVTLEPIDTKPPRT